MSLLSSAEAYRQAGVDLDRAQSVVQIASRLAQKTQGASALLGGIGGFSGAFELPAGYHHPVLLTGCDGVGTKLKLAFELGIHHTVGIDLVAMSVNDILVNGGQPLVFLDYLATDQIRPEVFEEILTGIVEGCRQAGCILAGGETAEMPGFYTPQEYDLAGFCVGIAEKENLLPKKECLQPGNVVIGLTSSGLHSNGFSLVRYILSQHPGLDLNTEFPELGQTLGEALLTPTTIYVKPILNAFQQHVDAFLAMAHITGGGLLENIPRVLPTGLSVKLDKTTWTAAPIFGYLQQLGKLSEDTLVHTFNAGIGFVIIVKADQAKAVVKTLQEASNGYTAQVIGSVISTPGSSEVVFA